MRIIKLIGNPGGQNNDAMNRAISHIDGVHGAVVAHAETSAAKAAVRLAQHSNEGDAKITTTEGEVDAFVNLDDTDGLWAAAAIEFGHVTRSGKRVEGLYIITRATGLVR